MPLSKPRYTLSEAIGDPKDWMYTWALADDVTLESRCGFCGQTEQRITYQVTRGDDRKWVCQRCVGRYAIGGVLDGYLLEPAEVRAQIHGLTARLKQQTCQDTIREVQAIANDPALEELLVYFDRNLQLSPQRAAVLFQAMRQLPEPVDVRIFEIQTRSVAHQDEFGALDDAARLVVWPALTLLQKRRLASLGHAPAGVALRKSRMRQQGIAEKPAGQRIGELSEPARLMPDPESL